MPAWDSVTGTFWGSQEASTCFDMLIGITDIHPEVSLVSNIAHLSISRHGGLLLVDLSDSFPRLGQAIQAVFSFSFFLSLGQSL